MSTLKNINGIPRLINYHVNKYPRADGLITYQVNTYPRMGDVRMHIWWFQKIDVDMTNCHLLNQYQWFAWMFIDFSIPMPFVSVSELPAALRRPQKKHALDFVSMHFICFAIFKQFQCPLVKKSKYGRSAQMTMPGRRASKFSPKRRALLLPCFSKSHLLSNSCEYRTFARMSTWAIGLINIHAQSN